MVRYPGPIYKSQLVKPIIAIPFTLMIMLGLGLGIALSYGQRNRSLVEGTEKRVSPLIIIPALL